VISTCHAPILARAVVTAPAKAAEPPSAPVDDEG
jgi:hypothetical protein